MFILPTLSVFRLSYLCRWSFCRCYCCLSLFRPYLPIHALTVHFVLVYLHSLLILQNTEVSVRSHMSYSSLYLPAFPLLIHSYFNFILSITQDHQKGIPWDVGRLVVIYSTSTSKILLKLEDWILYQLWKRKERPYVQVLPRVASLPSIYFPSIVNYSSFVWWMERWRNSASSKLFECSQVVQKFMKPLTEIYETVDKNWIFGPLILMWCPIVIEGSTVTIRIDRDIYNFLLGIIEPISSNPYVNPLLFCFILFYSVLFISVLFYSVLFWLFLFIIFEVSIKWIFILFSIE